MTEKIVHIRANLSFMDVRKGDESVCPLDATVQGWINAGFVTVLDELDEEPEEDTGGENQAGPGSAEPDDAWGEPDEG